MHRREQSDAAQAERTPRLDQLAVDVVDVFRRAEETPAIARSAAAIGAKVLWLQLGIRNEEAAAIAGAAGLTVIEDRCMKIEYGRLGGELAWSGINTRIISSRRRQLLG